jgi:hypothetical protein
MPVDESFTKMETLLKDALEVCANWEWGDSEWSSAVIHAHLATRDIFRRLNAVKPLWHHYTSTLRVAINLACLYANVYAYVLDDVQFEGIAMEAVIDNTEHIGDYEFEPISFAEAALWVERELAAWVGRVNHSLFNSRRRAAVVWLGDFLDNDKRHCKP